MTTRQCILNTNWLLFLANEMTKCRGIFIENNQALLTIDYMWFKTPRSIFKLWILSLEYSKRTIVLDKIIYCSWLNFRKINVKNIHKVYKPLKNTLIKSIMVFLQCQKRNLNQKSLNTIQAGRKWHQCIAPVSDRQINWRYKWNSQW